MCILKCQEHSKKSELDIIVEDNYLPLCNRYHRIMGK